MQRHLTESALGFKFHYATLFIWAAMIFIFWETKAFD